MQGHIYHSTFYTAGVSGLILADRCIVSLDRREKAGRVYSPLECWTSGLRVAQVKDSEADGNWKRVGKIARPPRQRSKTHRR